ncbi:hypothetical protein WME91_05515 [Sorangium sp. So ce269]
MPRPTLTFALLFALASFALGCSGSEPCEVVCAKNAECQPDGPGKDTCVALCRDLSDRASYADAIEHQAECYEEEDWSCDQLASGACDYSPED